MYDFKLKIADLVLDIHCKYELSYKLCKEYEYFGDLDPVLRINTILDKPNKELFLHLKEEEKRDDYIEFIYIHAKLASILYEYKGVLIHGAAISYKNKGYLFIAPSGTGKSTHTNMWLDNLKDASPINGDKPIIRIINDSPIIYGTPWCGKEKIGSNVSYILDSIVILKRGETNSIRKIESKDFLNEIINQLFLPTDTSMLETFNIINKIFDKVRVFEMYCTKDIDAFKMSYKELTGETYESK